LAKEDISVRFVQFFGVKKENSNLNEGRLMKSWKAVRFGTPEEALRIQELEIPAPGDGQVAIKVRAASVSLLASGPYND
jgi:hypothetical protein